MQEQFAWRDRLFLAGAVRVDNNSAFGQDFKWVTYPKASASWVVSDEPFWNWGRPHQHAAPARRVRRGRAAAHGVFRAANVHAGRRPERHERGHAGQLGQHRSAAGARRGDGARIRGRPLNRLSFDFTYYNKTTHERDRRASRSRRRPGSPAASSPTSARSTNNGIELEARLQAITRRTSAGRSPATSRPINNVIKSNITNTIRPRGSTTSSAIRSAALVAPRRLGRPRSDDRSGDQRDVRRGARQGAGRAARRRRSCTSGTPTPKYDGLVGNTFMIGKSRRFYALARLQGAATSCGTSRRRFAARSRRRAALPRELLPAGVLTEYLAEAGLVRAVGQHRRPVHAGRVVRQAARAVGDVLHSEPLPPRDEPVDHASPPASSTRGPTTAASIPKAPRRAATTQNGATAIDQGVTPPLTRFIVTLNFAW